MFGLESFLGGTVPFVRLGHDSFEVLQGDLAIVITVCSTKHQPQSLLVQISIRSLVDALQVSDIDVSLALQIVLLENSHNKLVRLFWVLAGFGTHSLHEVFEGNQPCLFGVQFFQNTIGCVIPDIESMLFQIKDEIVRDPNHSSCGVIDIEHLFQVDDILVCKLGCDVLPRIELFIEVESLEPLIIELEVALAPF